MRISTNILYIGGTISAFVRQVESRLFISTAGTVPGINTIKTFSMGINQISTVPQTLPEGTLYSPPFPNLPEPFETNSTVVP